VKVIDLRSDTVTHPTPAMREAMATAEVGDDVFGDDPTVNRLEAMAARIVGKEAAVFVASGTMGNLVALLSHCKRGDEAIVGSETHMLYYEVGAAAGLGGVQLRPVPNDRQGRLDPKDVEAMIRGQDIHYPRTSLVCLENTHNRCGGAVLTAADTAAVARVAHDHGAAVHVDGARIFNAAVALGVPAASLVEEADSISFCLSKGLSAPVGSLVCGSGEFVERARKSRKMLGGGMRQVGVLAAPGIVALEGMVERLQEDHENARLLAQGLADIEGIDIEPEAVQTNIVIFDVPEQKVLPLCAGLAKAGVLALPHGPGDIRMVTHYGVSRQDIEEALERVRDVCSAGV
jgi:threonine aldolase